ncbi:hypothetical protein [uncultured Thiodictyon sp.]|nr:hypothetical protein [uncultured Thiodictyon sp.]
MVGLFDYDNDNDSVLGISATTSVRIAPGLTRRWETDVAKAEASDS